MKYYNCASDEFYRQTAKGKKIVKAMLGIMYVGVLAFCALAKRKG